VEKAFIERIIDGARFAPTGHNAQSTEFVVVRNRETIKKISELTAHYFSKASKQLRNPLIKMMLLVVARNEIEGALHLMGDFDRILNEFQQGKDTILHNAPSILFFHGDRGTNLSDVNASLALQNAQLVCHSLGLGCFYAGYVAAACKRDNRIPGLLSIPKNHQVYGALAIGHPRFMYPNWIERRPPRIEWR
ncbi:MAG: nitroreductase, partial [Syntrophus sp. (in: bacteria)]|nr:nitroreductase [Syntrophus sp. (in: bacteria)]